MNICSTCFIEVPAGTGLCDECPAPKTPVAKPAAEPATPAIPVVEFNGERWECSLCGPRNCKHIGTHTHDLPRAQALDIARQVGARKPKSITASGPTVAEIKSAEEATARIVRSGADARAARAAEHDRHFRAASEVVVRKQTEADRERLRAARERKRRLRGVATPDDVRVRLAR